MKNRNLFASATQLTGTSTRTAPTAARLSSPPSVPIATETHTPETNGTSIVEPTGTVPTFPTKLPTPTKIISGTTWALDSLIFEENGSIYAVERSGLGKRKIVSDERIISISPDGSKVISAFGHEAILRSHQGELLRMEPGYEYVWSPDSNYLLVQMSGNSVEEQNGFELWDMSPIALKERLTLDAELKLVALKNDGNSIFDTLDLDALDYGPPQLDLEEGHYAYDYEDRALSKIMIFGELPGPAGIGGKRPPVISPGGEKLAISADGVNIWVYDLVNRRLEKETAFSEYPGGVGQICWSSDEQYIAFEQFELYHRDLGEFENRISILDLSDGSIQTISDWIIPDLVTVPPDFYELNSHFRPAGWDLSSTGIYAYFETETDYAAFGHKDHPDYSNLQRMHNFWFVQVGSPQFQELSWLADTHTIYPTTCQGGRTIGYQQISLFGP